MDLLFLAAEQNTPINYLPVVVQLCVALGFVAVTIGATHLLGPKRQTSDKLINFESGIPSVGNARQPMAIKYFLVACSLLFRWSMPYSKSKIKNKKPKIGSDSCILNYYCIP